MKTLAASGSMSSVAIVNVHDHQPSHRSFTLARTQRAFSSSGGIAPRRINRTGVPDHQWLSNKLIEPGPEVGQATGEVECRERLGEQLSYDHRRAA
jgi:hypothetical protein